MAKNLVLRANEKRVQKSKIKKKFQKKYLKVIKFIESSMPFTICYLKEPFMS